MRRPSLSVVGSETPAQQAKRLTAEAHTLAQAAENAALSVWREALAEAEELAALDCASVGGRQIARDVAGALAQHIARLQVLHGRRS